MPKIIEPTLLLDEAVCRNNIRRMAAKAEKSGVRFRPHFKTHQSLVIGEWFRECGVEAITVSMACPVIASHADRLIIHGGAVHFSKDYLAGEDGQAEFGWVVDARERGWGNPVDGLKLTALSQEHGIITGPEQVLQRYSVGDFVYILPVHSCMTADAMKRYLTLEGELITHLEAG